MQLTIRSRNIALLLLIASVILYGLDYWVFGHGEELAIGFLANLAFLPVYVLFVTLMIERVLKERERIALRQKLNMVIGVFFSEVGRMLLRECFVYIVNGESLLTHLKIASQWVEADFRRVSTFLLQHDIDIDSRRGDLPGLKLLLGEKRAFLLGLLENPNLLEHDEFTDLLWAVFHLLEELEARQEFTGLPEPDLDHLSGDIKRAYRLLLREWIVYLGHLKADYPYLFSLAVRTNPLDPEATPELRD